MIFNHLVIFFFEQGCKEKKYWYMNMYQTAHYLITLLVSFQLVNWFLKSTLRCGVDNLFILAA